MTNPNIYYAQLRTDVLDAVPHDAHYVLSVGCANGTTEQQLIGRGCIVAGVELHPPAAALAKARGVTIIEGDASAVDVAQFGLLFDCIIYADILEHLPDPEHVLQRHVQYLRPGGKVYITVPNFRHCSVLWQLGLRGEVIYKDAGILDRTHLRLTTRKMVIRWLRCSGLKPVRIQHRFFGRRLRYISALTGGLFRDWLAHHIAILASRST